MKRNRPHRRPKGRRRLPSRHRLTRLESLEPRRLLAVLAGQVWDDVNSDGSRDPGESGIADVRVYVDSNNSATRESDETFAWTDASGAFVIEDLPAGDYTLRFEGTERIQQSSPGSYWGTAYRASGNQTELFEMGLDGTVRRTGGLTGQRITGLIRTDDGQIWGSSHQNDTIYTINPATGAESVVGASGAELVAGLAYDATSDTIYTVGATPDTPTVQQLMRIDPATGVATPIGPGVDGGPQNTSDLAFDSAENRIVGFDNASDSFFSFDLDGNYQALGTISGGFDSWSLAFNGSQFVMMDQADTANQRAVAVDPETGEIDEAFTASESLPSEALFYSSRGDVPYQVTLAAEESLDGLDFGVAYDRGTDFDRAQGREFFINELFLEPVFAVGGQTEQYLELRGEPNQRLPLGTYFVALDGDNFTSSFNNGAGEVLTVIDLSNQRFGANGMLVVLPQGSPFQPHPESAVLRSTGPGFSGLPGGIFQTQSFGIWGDDSIAHFGLGDYSYLLVQSDTPPTIAEDVDADDDGSFDFESPADDWYVYDSVSIHSFSSAASIAYGSVVYYDSTLGAINVQTAAGATVIAADDVGYVGRIGDSTGYTENDWVGGSVLHNNSSVNLRYYLEDGFFGPPRPYVYMGRFLDHVGESNFVGGVRGTVAHDLNGNDVSDADEPPLAGATVLADTNGNGTRDNLSFVLEPDGYANGTDLRNIFSGVTLTQTRSGGEPTSGSINADRPFLANANDHVFSRGGFDWFTPSSQLRFDFYRPVNTVAIDAIGSSNFTPVYGRLEAFDSDGESLGFVHSNGLGRGIRETLRLQFQEDVIAYAVAYSDTNTFASSSFGSFDRLQFSQYEASTVTDENGHYELTPLMENTYEIRLSSDTAFQIGAEPREARVERYENYHIDFAVRPNSAPTAESAGFTLDEHARAGTTIGTIVSSDPDTGQELRYRIVGGSAADAVAINSQTGELRVRRAEALDFETNADEIVIVEAYDPFGASATAAATISLNNINDQPVIETEELFVSEGATDGLVIGRIFFSDQDEGLDGTATIEVVGGTAAELVEVDPVTGSVTLVGAEAIDFETAPLMTLRVRATDQAAEPRNRVAELKLLVRDMNEAPTITSGRLPVAETVDAGEAFALITIDDPDFDQNHFFRVEGGSGVQLFTVDRNSGVVSVARNVELDFETEASFTLDILVSDSGSPALSHARTIEVVLSDVNEPPSLIDAHFTTSESAQPGDVVGQLAAVDPDPDQSIGFQIIGGTGHDTFRVDADGTLRVADQVDELDFEGASQYSLQVQLTDDGVPIATATQAVVIDLIDADEPPSILTQSIVVPEGARPDAIISRIEAVDPDQDDTVAYSIIGGSAQGRLTIDALTGELQVASEATFDYETEPTLSLVVQVTDRAGNASQQTVEVQIEDRNERPLITTPIDNVSVEAGMRFELQIGTDRATDPDNDQTLLYSVAALRGSLPNWLSYDLETGLLSGVPNQTHVGSTAIALRVSDGLASAVQVFTISVQPSERPFQNGQNPFDVDNNEKVEPADALRIINFMNRIGTGPIEPSLGKFLGFIDTNGDGQVTPHDILGIINELNRLSREGSSGEGEPQGLAGTAQIPLDDDSLKRRAASADAAITELYRRPERLA